MQAPSQGRRANRRALVVVLTGALLFGAAAPRRAGAVVALQGVLTASAGVTDNVDSAPTEPTPGFPSRRTDLILTVSPGLVLTLGGSRAVQNISYFYNGQFYARTSSSNTYTNNVAYNGFFIPSKRTTFALGLVVSQGQQSTFNGAVDSATPVVQVQPARIINILNIAANQAFGIELTQRWRLQQTLGFSTAYFIGNSAQAATQAVPGRLIIEYAFPHDVVGLGITTTYTNFLEQRGPVIVPGGAVDGDGIVTPRQEQVAVTPVFRWRRDLTYFLNARAELGAVVIFDPNDTSRKLTEPAGGAGLNLFSRLVSLDIAYAHGADPNLILRSNFLTDLATLRGTFLLGEKSGFSLSLGLGYAYSRQLDPANANAIIARAQTVTGDMTITYRALEYLSFFLRYQLTDQIANTNDPIPLTSYYRNTLLFGLAAIYPPRIPAAVPKKPFGLRADGRDAPGISSSKSTAP